MSNLSDKIVAKMWVFESSSSDKTYQTLQYTDGTTSCDCRGWTIKKPGKPRMCRHTRDVDSGMADQNCVKMVDYTKTGKAKMQTPKAPVVDEDTDLVAPKKRVRKIQWK